MAGGGPRVGGAKASRWRMVHAAPGLSAAALRGELVAALAKAGPGTWERGWLLAAVGRYGEALSVLEPLDSPATTAAAALVTRGSVLRQVCLHAHAEPLDLEASSVDEPSVRAAALISLVADGVGLGIGVPALRDRLQRAARATTEAGDWRQMVRLGWVRGEVCMVQGDAAEALQAFTDSVRVAEMHGFARHALKSRGFLAATSLALGDAVTARRRAERVATEAMRMAALPLRWPALLVASEAAHMGGDRAGAAALRRAAADALRPLLWRLPPALRREALQRSPAADLVA